MAMWIVDQDMCVCGVRCRKGELCVVFVVCHNDGRLSFRVFFSTIRKPAIRSVCPPGHSYQKLYSLFSFHSYFNFMVTRTLPLKPHTHTPPSERGGMHSIDAQNLPHLIKIITSSFHHKIIVRQTATAADTNTCTFA